MNIDERIEAILDRSSGGDVRLIHPDGRSEIKDAKVLLVDDIKQLIRDVLDEVTPSMITNAADFDFTLHDNDPAGNNAFAYNCACDEVRQARRELGL